MNRQANDLSPRSSAESEQLVSTQQAVGSNPTGDTTHLANMAKIVDLREFLRHYCVELTPLDEEYVLKKLGIDLVSAVCARCTYPFTEDEPPTKIALISDEDGDEVYMLFCDHCDKYIRNC